VILFGLGLTLFLPLMETVTHQEAMSKEMQRLLGENEQPVVKLNLAKMTLKRSELGVLNRRQYGGRPGGRKREILELVRRSSLARFHLNFGLCSKVT
jgi:hypothetical protein